MYKFSDTLVEVSLVTDISFPPLAKMPGSDETALYYDDSSVRAKRQTYWIIGTYLGLAAVGFSAIAFRKRFPWLPKAENAMSKPKPRAAQVSLFC